MIAPWALREVTIACAIAAAGLVVSLVSDWWWPMLTAAAPLMAMWFYRDPHRAVAPDVTGLGEAVAPCDGRVTASSVDSGGVWDLVIYLSPMDVHVVRSPVAGVVRSAERRRGRYRAAYHPAALSDNAGAEVTIEMDDGRACRLWMIAGVLARGVHVAAEPGRRVAAGERIGGFRWGSCVRMRLPLKPGGPAGRLTVGGVVMVGDRIRAGRRLTVDS